GSLELVGGKAKVFDDGFADPFLRHARRTDPSQAVQLCAAKRQGIVDCLAHTILEFPYTVRQYGDAALALGPVARRQVVQDLLESETAKLLGKQLLRVGVREKVFDRAEAGLGGSLKPIGEFVLIKEHG